LGRKGTLGWPQRSQLWTVGRCGALASCYGVNLAGGMVFGRWFELEVEVGAEAGGILRWPGGMVFGRWFELRSRLGLKRAESCAGREEGLGVLVRAS